MWIDLTNTSRFYSPIVVQNAYGDDKEVKYFKLQCRGHGETPSEEQSKLFIKVCKNFISKYPLDVIGKLACVINVVVNMYLVKLFAQRQMLDPVVMLNKLKLGL